MEPQTKTNETPGETTLREQLSKKVGTVRHRVRATAAEGFDATMLAFVKIAIVVNLFSGHAAAQQLCGSEGADALTNGMNALLSHSRRAAPGSSSQ